MAGENVLVPQHYPDQFEVATYSIHNFNTLSANTAWVYCDRDIIVDAFYVGVSVAAQAGAVVKLVKTAGGATGTSGSPTAFALTAASLASGTAVDITNSIALDSTGTKSGTVINTANFVDEGNWIGLCCTTAPNATLVGAIVMRFRTRPK
tara:strand:- start:278 stop:727 length:450 start_codon:yes stop_codon:yes gene_type:complete